MKRGLIYSAFVLAIGSILAKFVGVFLKVPLVNIVGDYGMGLYQLPYPIYTTILTFSMTGFSLAISRMISFYQSQGEYYILQKVFDMSLCMILIISFLFTTTYLLFADTIISTFKWPSDSYLPYISLAPAIFIVSVQSVFRGLFNGLKEMDKTAISQIIESLLRVIVGLILCSFMLRYGLEYAVSGALLGASIGALFSLTYLVIMYKRRRRLLGKAINHSFKRKINHSIMIIKELLINTIYFSLSSFLISFISIIDSLLYPYFMNIANYSYRVTSELFGIFSGKVMTLIHVPLTFSVSMAVSLIPYISSVMNNKEKRELINKSFEYIFMINIPSAMAFLFFSDEIMSLVFFSNSTGAEFLKVSSIIAIVVSIMQLTTSILQGLNKFFIPIKNIIISMIIKIALLFVFIVIYNFKIVGCIFANIFCYLIICILNFIELKKEGYSILHPQKLLYITLASVIMVITGLIVKNSFYIHAFWLKDIILIVLCVCVYFISLLFVGMININKLKSLFLR